jgi:transcriptional regulator with XRE-family HTH domain
MKQSDQSGRRDRQASVLGTFLKVQRESAGLSLAALSELTGVSRTQLSRIERGISGNPSSRLLVRIAVEGGLTVSAADLLHIAAGCLGVSDLPDFRAYLYAKHPDWPDAAVQQLVDFYQFIANRYSHDQQ